MPRGQRAIILYSLILLLIIQILPLSPAPAAVSAAGSEEPFRILEITESGKSDLSLGAGYSVDTMAMKRFVALRTDIDGLYDAVYIGKGSYSPEGMTLTTDSTRQAAHNTTAKLNDITNLKAQAIIDGYVNKGLLVLLYSDAASSSGLLYQKTSSGTLTPGVLHNRFSPFSTASGRRDNVLYLDAAGLKSLSSTLSQPKYAAMLSLRPRLKLTASPVSYTSNASQIYRAGDTLSFQYEKPSRSGIRANLYLNQDSSLPYTADQVVATSDAAGAAGSLSFRLPRGFSGLYYWKLELVDMESGVKAYTSGAIRFRDKQTQISVLQVMPNNDSGSALTSGTRMNQSYLTTDDYKIAIRTVDMTGFNRKGAETSYDMIGNGRYDMLIFGFKDSYNTTAGISQAAADVVKDFIGTGQSVMFTHDTVFISSGTADNVWTSNFKALTGQIMTYTNIGLGAPLTSTTVQNVNDGLLTRFPFNLKAGTPAVATTHDQYYMLDLEDPSIVPWYNISGGSRNDAGGNSYDSYNHYYTYSKGNVTYSGTGHNLSFPDWEQQLFVNTMYRAYMGSNHKPELNVQLPVAYSTTDKNIIPAYQDIPVSFTPEDFDINDRKLQVKVEFKYLKDGRTITETKFQSSQALSGALIADAYPNPLPKGGDLEVIISVQDKQGAKSETVIPVKIEVVSANLKVIRSAASLYKDSMVERGKEFQLNYQVLPQPVENRQGETERMVISSPSFEERFPANLEITSLPAGFTKTGTAADGYTVRGNLPDIRYRPDNSETTYTAAPIPFTVKAKALQTGTFNLNAAPFSFRNIGESSIQLETINPMTLQAVVPLTKLAIPGAQLDVGDSYKLLPAYEPADASIGGLSWKSSNPDAVSVTDIGTVKGLKANSSSIITVTDTITGISATSTVSVIQTGLTISTANNANSYTLGSRIDLKAALVKSTGQIVSGGAVWSVTPQQASDAGVENMSSSDSLNWTGTFYPKRPGTYKIQAAVTTTQNGSAPPKIYGSNELNVTVVEPDLVLGGPAAIVAGDNKAQWERSWGTSGPVADASRPVIYRWTWSPQSGAAGTLSTGSDDTLRKMSGIAAGSGILRLEALQKLKYTDTLDQAITLGVKTVTVSIAARPELTIGKNSLLPSQTTNLGIRWTGTAPAYSAAWSAPAGLSLSSKSNAGAQLTALQPLSPAGMIEVVVSMTDTGYSFPLQASASVAAPKLQLSGMPELLLAGEQSTALAGWASGEGLPLNALSWSLGSGASRASLEPASGSSTTLTGRTPGPVAVQAAVRLTDAYTAVASKSVTIADYRLAPSLSLTQKDSVPLAQVLTVLPDKSYEARVGSMLVWTSGNSGIAVVTDGKIVAVGRGTTTLTAAYGQSGVKKTIKVTVTAPTGDRY